MDAKIRENQEKNIRRFVAPENQEKAIQEAGALLENTTQQQSAGDAFRQVTNNAVVAGLQDVAGVANALSAGKLEQSLNDASGGSLGSDIFGTYGTTSVSRMNEANAQMMRDQGNNTGAFITDAANTVSNVAFNAIPVVTGLGASTAATSLAGRAGKLVSSVDNILGSPGSLVGMGKSALGSIDNVVSGGRATKFLSSLGSSFGQGLSSVGRGMGKGLAALGTKIGKTTSPSYRDWET